MNSKTFVFLSFQSFFRALLFAERSRISWVPDPCAKHALGIANLAIAEQLGYKVKAGMQPLSDAMLTTRPYFPSPSLSLSHRHLMQQMGIRAEFCKELWRSHNSCLQGTERRSSCATCLRGLSLRNYSSGYIAVCLWKY